jgi:hypothetical protein
MPDPNEKGGPRREPPDPDSFVLAVKSEYIAHQLQPQVLRLHCAIAATMAETLTPVIFGVQS